MEPLDPRASGVPLPPPSVVPGVAAIVVAPTPSVDVRGDDPAATGPATGVVCRPMAPWRVIGALSLATTFALIGWQVWRLVDDRPWSSSLMWLSVLAGVAAAACVLGWTWTATDNARRLVEPANRANVPDPWAAVRTWIAPFLFIAVAVGIVVMLGRRSQTDPDGAVSAVPLAVAVTALLLAIPMTYRPMFHLAGVVRQVGGYTVRVARWMWVPVVMALVGVASIVALRYVAVDDAAGTATSADEWVPLWVVAVVSISPCVITVLLAWRAAASVEDAITVAAHRRGSGRSGRARAATPSTLAIDPRISTGEPVVLVPGAELLRLVTVTLMAGQALLSLVGAVVVALLWLDSIDTGVLPAHRERTLDALDALRAASAGVVAALLVVVFAWTLVAVLNVRRTTRRGVNPLIAAGCWPAAAAAVWWIADRVIVDQSTGEVVLGFAAQAAVLAVPFLVLERSVDAVGARRTPLRIVYVLAVVLLVHVQGLGGLLRLPETATTTEVGRLIGYLVIGALIQLCSTLAVTEACRGVTRSYEHEADRHNMLVGARSAARQSAVPLVQAVTAP